MPPGQGHRQLHLAQGRRGRVSPPRQARPALRRRRGRHGVRRAGPGRRPRRQGPHLHARLPAPRRPARLSRPGTSSSTPTSSPSPPASRSTTTTPSISSRRSASSSRPCPAPRSAAACPTSRSPSAATTRCARPCTRRSSTTPSRPASTWPSSTPACSASTRRFPADLLERIEDVLLNRRPDATERLVTFAEELKAGAGRRRPGPRLQEDLAWREPPGRGAPQARAGQGHRHLRRGRHRGMPAEIPAPARHHRGAADGRHARGRRPVRRRQDVPAAGREIRPRDEEGRRLPHAVHGGGEARA